MFQPIEHPLCSLREATIADLLLYDRPRKKNLYIPRLYQSLHFDQVLYEQEATELFYNHFDFAAWSRNRNVYLASCVYFHQRTHGQCFELFKPTELLQQKIDYITRPFTNPTYGVHIRRTDNTTSIMESPTELFIQRIKEEISLQPEIQFYLATDSEEDKKELLSIFGRRIHTSPYAASRSNVKGMKDALIEMYVLSRTQKIMGSVKSSYSETAAQIGNIPCELIQRTK